MSTMAESTSIFQALSCFASPANVMFVVNNNPLRLHSADTIVLGLDRTLLNECNRDLSTINACFPSCPRYLTVLLSGSHSYNFHGIDRSDRHEYLPDSRRRDPVRRSL